ncbi:hypothetical protein AKO1_008309 [Acrasis kona]|uniref:Uncharacterized protein n=1 Tax=Acrasis kona TaxID=1008807 RepID=A0AAW2YPF8_9EUKA
MPNKTNIIKSPKGVEIHVDQSKAAPNNNIKNWCKQYNLSYFGSEFPHLVPKLSQKVSPSIAKHACNGSETKWSDHWFEKARIDSQNTATPIVSRRKGLAPAVDQVASAYESWLSRNIEEVVRIMEESSNEEPSVVDNEKQPQQQEENKKKAVEENDEEEVRAQWCSKEEVDKDLLVLHSNMMHTCSKSEVLHCKIRMNKRKKELEQELLYINYFLTRVQPLIELELKDFKTSSTDRYDQLLKNISQDAAPLPTPTITAVTPATTTTTIITTPTTVNSSPAVAAIVTNQTPPPIGTNFDLNCASPVLTQTYKRRMEADMPDDSPPTKKINLSPNLAFQSFITTSQPIQPTNNNTQRGQNGSSESPMQSMMSNWKFMAQPVQPPQKAPQKTTIQMHPSIPPGPQQLQQQQQQSAPSVQQQQQQTATQHVPQINLNDGVTRPLLSFELLPENQFAINEL